MIPKSIDELGEELCVYCPIPDNLKGVHCYGGEPVFCQDYGGCDEAYRSYLNDFEENKDIGGNE